MHRKSKRTASGSQHARWCRYMVSAVCTAARQPSLWPAAMRAATAGDGSRCSGARGSGCCTSAMTLTRTSPPSIVNAASGTTGKPGVEACTTCVHGLQGDHAYLG